MNHEDRILAALKALSDDDRGTEAPPRVEAELVKGFRRRKAIRRAGWIGALAAVAAIAVVLIANRPAPSAQPPAQIAVDTASQIAIPAAAAAPVVADVVKPRRRAVRRPPPQPVYREVATEFYPLVNVAPPFESGELRRVVVPASTMLRVGVPVHESRWADPVEADILIGQEGIARAIRFVSYEQQ